MGYLSWCTVEKIIIWHRADLWRGSCHCHWTRIMQLARSPCSRSHTHRTIWSLQMYTWMNNDLHNVVRWDQHWAPWHQLDLPCLEGQKCWLRMLSQPSSMKVETLSFGVVSLLRVQGDFTPLRGRWTGPCIINLGRAPPSFSQNSEDRWWMGIPAWQWPKMSGQGNKGVAEGGAH